MTKDLPVSAARKFFWSLSFLPLLVALAATGCNRIKGSPTNAHMEGNTYTNLFFEFALNVPGGWTIADEARLRRNQDAGKKLLAGGDEKMKATLDGADKNSYQLIAASQAAKATPGEINPNFAAVAERVGAFSGVKNGSDYLAHVNKLLTGEDKPFKQAVAPYKTKFAGRDFYRMDMSALLMGRSIYQGYLATIEKGFALAFVVTGDSKEGVDNVLARINPAQAAP